MTTASKYAKQAGLRSLAEAVRMTGRSADTLTRWHKDMPNLFRVVILGCLEVKKQEKLKVKPAIEAGRYVMVKVTIVDGMPVASFEPLQ